MYEYQLAQELASRSKNLCTIGNVLSHFETPGLDYVKKKL
jgi:hypothetical protein